MCWLRGIEDYASERSDYRQEWGGGSLVLRPFSLVLAEGPWYAASI